MALNLKTTKWLYVEHYLYGLVLAAFYNTINTLFSTGTHDYKGLLWSFVEGIALPILTKAVPKSAFNKVAKNTGVSSDALAALTAVAQTKAADSFKNLVAKQEAVAPVVPSITKAPDATPPASTN